ncbi:hypothetical protein HPHPH28_1278 [Helicobacter pylori Hp H-28]|nr:hypothetical protein HPHPH28_1278 [Helicobacter pylori Hp H-28]
MVVFGDDKIFSFWISFYCKTLKGVGGYYIPLCNLIKIP